ncbi:MAG: transposase, partial [Mycobacterium sp.]|nr:transposase [Mycobacterium sp.]
SVGRQAGEASAPGIVDAILYVVRTGCAWRQLPADFLPWETVYWYFGRWEQQKLTFRIGRRAAVTGPGGSS